MSRHAILLKVVAAVIVSVFVIGGAGYGVYKYNQISSENHQLLTQLEFERNEKIDRLEAELEAMKQSDTLDGRDSEADVSVSLVENSVVASAPKVETVVQERVVYVPQAPVSTQPEVAAANEAQNEPDTLVTENTDLKVINVEHVIDEEENLIRIDWETTLASDSRLILDEKEVFNSNNSDSTEHFVIINALSESKKYNYEIVAKIGAVEDSYFGKFQAPREYVVRFGEIDDEGCTEVITEDTEGYPLSGALLKLSGYYGSGTSNFAGDTVEAYTDAKGVIAYCDPIERFWVVDVVTKEVYYDSR
ncbi:hypothetical protein H6778_00245 [Candidatus Nomurabacteria bacterium]|uniref:Uncharacterized protein n=1 Tax=candidate division WWE3 bacterium TaxID=2053526 RepID=A0A955LW29_UNCKA|nr:hypothetical protein [candidate division WWE3 bacterium]MCB9812077.1 hypothetical protein [Candidatus Nomurabacteria bacterium]